MQIITIKGEPRPRTGSRVARKLRAEGSFPAVIYGHGQPPESVTLAGHEVGVALDRGPRILQLDMLGQVKPYLIKEVQYDHLSTTPIHMDLARVDLTERVKVRVGIEPRGVPKGIHDGGVLDQQLAQIEVECLVTEIPDTFHPVVTHLGLGESLLVKDLVLPPGVVALVDGERSVATVRVLAEEAAAPAAVVAEGEAAAGAEPERIGRIKKEEPAEGEAAKEKK